MCTPAIMTGLTVASTLFGAYTQYQQGRYQSQVAKNNAMIQQRMAQDALARGTREEQMMRIKVAQEKGRQRAQFGASGAEVGSGSSLSALADTAMMGELDALTLRSGAQREAYAHQMQASQYQAQSKLDRAAGLYGAAGTLLGGAGRVSEQWYKYGKGNKKPSGTGSYSFNPMSGYVTEY